MYGALVPDTDPASLRVIPVPDPAFPEPQPQLLELTVDGGVGKFVL